MYLRGNLIGTDDDDGSRYLGSLGETAMARLGKVPIASRLGKVPIASMLGNGDFLKLLT